MGSEMCIRDRRRATINEEESQICGATDDDGDCEDPGPMTVDSEGETLPSERYRRKNGSGLAGKVLSALMMSAQALAGAAHESWTKTVRYNRLDFAEVCCTADSQLSGEVLSRGGTAQRYSHWNGLDLTTQKLSLIHI